VGRQLYSYTGPTAFHIIFYIFIVCIVDVGNKILFYPLDNIMKHLSLTNILN